MDNSEQVHKLINTLRERPHVVEFANGCAKRAKGYARHAAYAAAADYDAATAADYADSADYAAAAAAAATSAYAASTAADAARGAAYATTATYAERDIQITHLKELHAREEKLCLGASRLVE